MTEPSFETVIYQPGERVSKVTINRPDAMNAFNVTLRAELPKALDAAAADGSRVVVLDASGRGFGAGADLKEGFADSLTQQLNEEYRPTFDAIESCAKPVISAIHGAAAGVSLSVALACDLTVMADNAFLLAPFTSIGLIPDGGAHFVMGRQLGYKRAFQILVEAERVNAQSALDFGLVNRVVPADELSEATLAWADSFADRAPLAMASIKKILRGAMHQDFDTVFRAEAVEQQVCRISEDCAEGVSAFLEKRPATFRGK
ncbi:MAG: enoyl-CoA hydratase/isomerase family protein [Gammaproteobacteria bacterium]